MCVARLSERRRDVQSFATGRLAETFESDRAEAGPHLLRGLDDSGEFNVRCRVEVEDETPRDIRLVRHAVPRMQLDPTALCHSGQGLDAVDHYVRLAVAGHPDHVEQI